MTVAAIIVAAGRGTRAGGDAPKQWQLVAQQAVARWTVQRFADHSRINDVVVVIHPEDEAVARTVLGDMRARMVHGGADRAASVRAGLEALSDAKPKSVLIHDVARPCVSDAVIDEVIDALDLSPAAAPALAVTDALWRVRDGAVSGVQDRTGLYRAQTPQGFEYGMICAAHGSHSGGAADDVEVARAYGVAVSVTQGSEQNLKITTPEDFARAARILET